MSDLTTLELHACVPSRDFEISKRFYTDLGFTMEWSDPHLAYFRHGGIAFLLQSAFVEAVAKYLMMHLMVQDLDAWWLLVSDQQIATKYAQTNFKLAVPPVSAAEFAAVAAQHPGAIRDFVIFDPTGVLWRIAELRR